MKKNVLMIYCAFYTILLGVFAFGKDTTVSLDADQLLNKCTQTLEKMNSFIIESNEEIKYDISRGNQKGTMYQSNCYKYDGIKNKLIGYTWGDINPMEGHIQKENASYSSHLWDGDKIYSYSRNGNKDNGYLILESIDKNTTKVNDASIQTSFCGQAIGYSHGEKERIDNILKSSSQVKLREKTENIQGVDCFVIDSTVKNSGNYQVWIDPEHGYQIVKMQTQRTANDNIWGNVLNKGDYENETYEVLEFEKIGDMWFPKECKYVSETNTYENPRKEERIIKFTSVTFNPDHEKLGSFEPDDIPNGADVRDVHIPGIRYTWQDGKLIPNIDKEVISEIDKMAKAVLDNNKEKIQPEKVSETVKSLLEKYSATQNQLKSFIAKADSQIDYPGSSKTSEKEQSEFRTDGDKVNLRITIFDNLQPAKINQYSSYLWNGQSMIQYSKNSVNIQDRTETNKKRIISQDYRGGSLLGYFGGELERIDYILGKADSVSVQPKTELINDSQCYIIEAKTKTSSYKIWFDSQHGYNIAQLEMRRDTGIGVKTASLQNVRFEQKDNVWIPMEADIQQTEQKQIVKWHHKHTQMLLNPDHNKFASFVADDIPVGTKVSKQNDSIEYLWQNGKIVQKGELK